MSTDEGRHEYRVERVIAADPEALCDRLVEIDDGDEQADWVLRSESDLRGGGAWTVKVKPPGSTRLTEVRTIIELDR